MNAGNGIWALILAAGESKRMGFPKMMLNFNGVTMIETVIRNVRMSDVGEIMVVLGADYENTKNLVAGQMVKYCLNSDYRDGMLSSVKCGLASIPEDAEAVLVFQGDQPFIGPAVINSVIDAFHKSGKQIIIPVYHGKRGHPLLISSGLIKAVDKISSREGLRSLAYSFPDDVMEVETDDPGILRDFDTYEDYRSEINKNS